MRKEKLILEAISLLKSLIKTPSFSSEEHHTALLIESWFQDSDISFNRTNNNIWAINKYFDETKPTILLNSHHDTVRPNNGYTKDPLTQLLMLVNYTALVVMMLEDVWFLYWQHFLFFIITSI